jgi:hypothetical protein
MIIVPSSAVETMGLGALGGLTAFGQTAAGTASQESELSSPEPGGDTLGSTTTAEPLSAGTVPPDKSISRR